jgi:hypothetical protein
VLEETSHTGRHLLNDRRKTCLAEEDVVVVLVTVKAERNGRSAAFPEVHVWRLANEKVTEFANSKGRVHGGSLLVVADVVR